jgi:hypothetical protein
VPNIYLKTEQRIQLALAELYRRANFSNLVTRFDGNAFIGALNDTVHYTLKGVTKARDYEWRTRTQPIVFDEIYRTKLNIVLNQHMTQGVKFTSEEEKLDLTSYRREILVPQVEAVAERFDSKITTALRAADWEITDLALVATGDAEGASALRQALAIKARLDGQGTPANGRRLIAGANPFAWLAASDALQKYDTEQAQTVFRRGVFGRIAGMDLVDGSQDLDENEFIVAHPSWAVMANLAPDVPAGAAWGARDTYEGWSLRVVRQYDINYDVDRSLVSTFWGLTEVKDQYARHTTASAASANDGSEKGDIIVVDGAPTFTGKNVRGAKGTFVPSA